MPHDFTADPTITITIPAHYAKVLANWASVSRTIQDALDNNSLGLDELEQIGPALDAMHQIIRTQLWNVKDGHECYVARRTIEFDAAQLNVPVEQLVAHYVRYGVSVR